MQYNGFLRIFDDKTLTYHEWDSLSIIYITSESSILTGFHTILRSKLNFKTQLQISLVLYLLGVISVTSPQCPLHVTRPEASAACYLVSTVVVHYTLLSHHRSGDLLHIYSVSTVVVYYTLPRLHSGGLLHDYLVSEGVLFLYSLLGLHSKWWSTTRLLSLHK